MSTRVGRVFAEEAFQAAGGAGWWHPALTARDRSIAVITALACQGVAGERLRTHLRLGREHGLDEAALTALMTLLASYAGYPRASLAMESVTEEFATAESNETGRTSASRAEDHAVFGPEFPTTAQLIQENT